jgi:uncharacterized protein (UPF0248 family)
MHIPRTEDGVNLVYPYLLSNGRLFYRQDLRGENGPGLAGAVAEADLVTGKWVGGIPPGMRVSSGSQIQPLGNGRQLICDSVAGRVLEVDYRGNILWRYDGRCQHALRLANGNTVITETALPRDRIIEVTRKGNIVWQITVPRLEIARECLPLVRLGFSSNE